MAKTGNPNGGGDPEWPTYSPENDAYLEIGATTVAESGPAEAHCDFWDAVPFALAACLEISNSPGASNGRARNRKFVDSLLEGDGFEPSVPGR
jgi:hypothetical protein